MKQQKVGCSLQIKYWRIICPICWYFFLGFYSESWLACLIQLLSRTKLMNHRFNRLLVKRYLKLNRWCSMQDTHLTKTSRARLKFLSINMLLYSFATVFLLSDNSYYWKITSFCIRYSFWTVARIHWNDSSIIELLF